MSHNHTLIEKVILNHPKFSSNALCFIPTAQLFKPNLMAIFTHGYTSSKTDLITWATRLSDAGITTIIFDLPGHYLGSFHDLNSLEDFQLHAHDLFLCAYKEAQKLLVKNNLIFSATAKIILGGHSLGALLALNCHKTKEFSHNTIYVGVGLGINPLVKVHLFDTDFYQKTLNIRKQLVSPALNPKEVFPWIKTHKYNTDMQGQHIVLICGKDDAVVGKNGSAYLKSLLEKLNTVELIEPERLPHHEPQLAAGIIYNYLKQFL